MRWLACLAVLSIFLAGCSTKEHSLDAYVMSDLDTPDSCYYIDPSDDDWADYAAIGGFDENPGAINNFYMTVDDVRPIENRFAVFECKFAEGFFQYVSGAWQFADTASAEQWAVAVQDGGSAFSGGARCVPQAMVFTDGVTIGAIATFSSEWHPAFEAAAQDRFKEILGTTSATDYCR
jgi:hypothetical protein